jgi:hypothetical protein
MFFKWTKFFLFLFFIFFIYFYFEIQLQWSVDVNFINNVNAFFFIYIIFFVFIYFFFLNFFFIYSIFSFSNQVNCLYFSNFYYFFNDSSNDSTNDVLEVNSTNNESDSNSITNSITNKVDCGVTTTVSDSITSQVYSNNFIPNQKKIDRKNKYYNSSYYETFLVDDGFGGKEKEIIRFWEKDNEEMIKTIKSYDKNKKYYSIRNHKFNSNNPNDFPILTFELKLINFVNDIIFDLDHREQNWLKENLLYYWREFQKKDFYVALNDPTRRNIDVSEWWLPEHHYRRKTKTIFKNTSVPLEHIELLFCKRSLCVSVFYGLKSHINRKMFYHLVTVRNLTINDTVYEIGLIYYETSEEKYRLDVLLPRSLELFCKSELTKHVQVFCTQQSVFSEKCLRYGSFHCPSDTSFSSFRHPKYKGLDEHEYYLGIPLRENINRDEEYSDDGDDSVYSLND